MKTSAKIIRLVTARLDVMPENVKVAILSYGTFNKRQLIAHVKKGDEIGKKIIQVELEYLKSFKKGIFYA